MKTLLLTVIVWGAALAAVFGERLLFPLVLAATAVIKEVLIPEPELEPEPEPEPELAAVPVVIEAPTPPATEAPKKRVTRKRTTAAKPSATKAKKAEVVK